MPVARVDVEKLLQPVSAAEPSGPNLEYDAEYAEMERAAQGAPEQQYGDTIIEAKEPEWGEVRRSCLDLLQRSKDVRILMHLARSCLRTGGLGDFCDALRLAQGVIEQFWETLHPQLDPEDDNDPTIRVNALASLIDVPTVIAPLRATPIVRSRVVGSFSRRDIAIATGEIPKPERRGGDDDDDGPKLPDKQQIDAAFQSCDFEQLKRDMEAAAAGAAAVRSLEDTVTRHVGAGQMRSLAALAKELDSIHKVLAEQVKRVGPAEAAPQEEPEEEEPVGGAPTSGGSASPGTKKGGLIQNWNADLTSRDEAIRVLEKVCQFYERNEPSSPLPLLLRRAIRLSSKSFLDILYDVSPDGLGQAEALGGMTREEYLQMLGLRGE